jgi:ATP-dependent exoDNAse (exonuclease V) alpha subunit
MPPGAEGIVSEIDTEANVIKTLMDNKGKLEIRTIDLGKYGDRLNVYRPANIELTSGDTVIFTKNDKDFKIDNGDMATVLSVGQDTLKVQVKDREMEINTKEYPYIDHGYAMTVHKSQGKSVEKVVIVANTQTQNTYNSFYVGVTRGKQELKIITNDIAEFKEQIKNEDRKLNIVEHKEQNINIQR